MYSTASTNHLFFLSFMWGMACQGPYVERSDYVITPDFSSDIEDSSSPTETEQLDSSEDGNGDTSMPAVEEQEYSLYAEVITLAGSGIYDSIDGHGEHSSFENPRLIRYMGGDQFLVVDSGSGELRIVDRMGNVHTPTISGEVPLYPSGLAISRTGDIYVSDYQQHCIFKIRNMHSVRYAGSCGQSGNHNGERLDALFHQPSGLAIGEDGALYIADTANHLIRAISVSGQVTTFAGTGEQQSTPSTGRVQDANLYLPFALAFHPSGDLYFSGFDHCIRRVRQGYLTDIAGLCHNHNNVGQADGFAEDARFNNPVDIAFTTDNSLVIADSFNNKIRRLSPDHRTISTLIGQQKGFEDGTAQTALLNTPRSVTLDNLGNLYIADSKNNRIRVALIE